MKYKPYSTLKIYEILLKVEGFKYSMSLGLSMGYYHIRLSYIASEVCTTILRWVKYRYNRLMMGISNYMKKIKRKRFKMFCLFEFIQAYINNLLIITNGGWCNFCTLSRIYPLDYYLDTSFISG